MPEFNQNYNFNSLYVCLLLVIYNIWTHHYLYINIFYLYINIFLRQVYLLNYTSFIIVINIIGLYLLLKKISFEVNINLSIKYN